MAMLKSSERVVLYESKFVTEHGRLERGKSFAWGARTFRSGGKLSREE